ncbi:hypothetical protein CQW23_27259 [Capsicum baccatum]|uniref:Agenet domain-containing protein n=1 Tax=Capsicum baccatum TaxID=33114 RepID=A0A2G2VD61_CAPBA|nr:hypothetical protein CQW23_27259 [Capsicum baccatum]
MYGLAYDAASDDYKILKIDVTSVGPEVFNEILALKSGSWKRVGKPSFRVLPVSCGVPSGRDCLAFVHGTFHWVGISNYGSTVVSFNISNEVYGQIPLLERMRIYRKRYLENEVSVLGGLLCFYSTANYQGEGTFNLWVMRDYGIKESWTNLYTIRDTDLYSARPKYRFADGEMLLSFRHLNRISLGPIFGTSKGQYFGLWPQCDTSREGFSYTESLISPKLLSLCSPDLEYILFEEMLARQLNFVDFPCLVDTPRSERRSALMACKQIATAKLPNYPKLKVKFPISGPAGIQLVESQHKLSFEAGDNVEVLCQDSGMRGCWFRCKILRVSAKRLKIQYDDILDCDRPEKLEEWIPSYRVANPDKLGTRCTGRLTVRPWPLEDTTTLYFDLCNVL